MKLNAEVILLHGWLVSVVCGWAKVQHVGITFLIMSLSLRDSFNPYNRYDVMSC